MTDFLANLPHQIPFRAISSAQKIDERTITGTYLCTASDALTREHAIFPMLIEAMAQLGGGLAFGDSGTHGFLSAIDDAEITEPFRAGDRIELRVRLEAEFQGIYRFQAAATREGTEMGRARFYLAAPAGPGSSVS